MEPASNKERNCMAYDNYNLFAHVDEHMTRPKFKAPRAKNFYPSEASVTTYDEHGDKVVHGGCMRAAYFRCSSHEFERIPNSARSEYIFKQGIGVEKILIDLWKEMGIWVDNNVKFVDAEAGISGELDALLMEPDGTVYGAEVKSFYGYFAEKELFGNRSTKAFPKMPHLLQTLIYLNFFKDKLPYFRIVYFARDSVKRRTFKVELHEEGDIIYPKVEGEVIRSFTVNDIYARYEELQSYLDNDIVPPNDYELYYSRDKIEDYFKKGKVAKTKYAKWQAGKLGPHEQIGDWNCSYCAFKNICWS